MCNTKTAVKPFLKWVGGKTQLINSIKEYYPFDDKITKYAEPFVGGGAVLFDILNNYELESIYISDSNAELINAYKIIKEHPEELINQLHYLELSYHALNPEPRKEYYSRMRTRFNKLQLGNNIKDDIEKAALMIFLNKTCFNGLYRVNKKGKFNASMGNYKNPLICDEENILAISEKLQSIEIVTGDYKQSLDFIDEHTFAYFDPPYRPLTNTSNFLSYGEDHFGDSNQIELKNFIDLLNEKGAKILTSNSDPKNADPNDNFFDDLYSSYRIERVGARRSINSNGKKRGRISELLISNF